MTVPVYLLAFLIIGLFSLILISWVSLAKSGISPDEKKSIQSGAFETNLWLKILTKILPLFTLLFGFLVTMAFLHALLYQSHSDLWLRNQKQIHYTLLAEMLIMIVINFVFAKLFAAIASKRRFYRISGGILAAILLVHLAIRGINEFLLKA